MPAFSKPEYVIANERFRAMLIGNARLETLGEGFGWLEGPVWFADHNMLLFSDIPGDAEYLWRAGTGISLYRDHAAHPNGHTRDRQGRLLTCSHGARAVLRREWDGSETVLADRYQGHRLNSPNDAVCAPDGTIWFTDPTYGIETDFEGCKAVSETPAAIYRLTPDGTLTAACAALVGPNGIALSPDARTLYVSDTGHQFAAYPDRSLWRFGVSADGNLSGGEQWLRVDPPYTDGVAVDEAGNLWLTAGDGVHCHAPDGTELGRILTPFPVDNLCFGGRSLARLFLCAGHSLLAIHVNVRGLGLV